MELEYVEADEENIFGIETPEHTASRQRIRSYYNNTHNTSNVEASRGLAATLKNHMNWKI